MDSFKTKHSSIIALALAGLVVSSSAVAGVYGFRVPSKGLRPAPAQAAAPAPVGPFTFTPCGATGAYGPTLSACNTAYSGTTLAGLVTIAPTQGIQTWTVPTTGTYTVVLRGAAGGAGPGESSVNGLGAVLTTQLVLTKNAVLKILVGQAGITGGNDGGGGGGTYVVSGGTALAVAGGGGGGGYPGNGNGDGYNASTTTAPTLSHGSGYFWGGGGSGFTTNGYNDTGGSGVSGGQSFSFLNGGNGGGTAINGGGAADQAAGGFGGGGGGGWPVGGGGGGYTTGQQGGAGGTTYTTGSVISSVANNAGDGRVTFTLN